LRSARALRELIRQILHPISFERPPIPIEELLEGQEIPECRTASTEKKFQIKK
jgi:hypothetical protein